MCDRQIARLRRCEPSACKTVSYLRDKKARLERHRTPRNRSAPQRFLAANNSGDFAGPTNLAFVGTKPATTLTNGVAQAGSLRS